MVEKTLTPPPAWHSQAAKKTFESLATRADGLSEKEAAKRFLKHGKNRLAEAKQRSPLQRFFAQFHNGVMNG